MQLGAGPDANVYLGWARRRARIGVGLPGPTIVCLMMV